MVGQRHGMALRPRPSRPLLPHPPAAAPPQISFNDSMNNMKILAGLPPMSCQAFTALLNSLPAITKEDVPWEEIDRIKTEKDVQYDDFAISLVAYLPIKKPEGCWTPRQGFFDLKNYPHVIIKPTQEQRFQDCIPTPDRGAECSVCGADGHITCPKCLDVRYCSPACEEEDKKFHDLVCGDDDNSFLSFKAENRPTPNSYRALWFGNDEKKPRWMWVDFSDGGDISFTCNDIMYQGKMDLKPTWTRNTRSVYAVEITNCTSAVSGSSVSGWTVVNKSLQLGQPGKVHVSMTGRLMMALEIQGRPLPGGVTKPLPWRSIPGGDKVRPVPLDFTMSDYRYVCDAIACDSNNTCLIDTVAFQGESLQAVKINCEVDCLFHGMASDGFEDAPEYVHVRKNLTAGEMQWVSFYANLLDLPWICRSVKPILRPYNIMPGTNQDLRSNKWLGCIGAAMPPHATQCPEPWETNGTLLVMRADGVPVHVIHIILFNAFALEKVMMYLDAFKPRNTARREVFLKQFNRAAFEKFWDDYEKRGLTSGVPSPWDTDAPECRALKGSALKLSSDMTELMKTLSEEAARCAEDV